MKHLWRTTKDGLYEVCQRCNKLMTLENARHLRPTNCPAVSLNEQRMADSKRYADHYCHPATAFQIAAAREGA